MMAPRDARGPSREPGVLAGRGAALCRWDPAAAPEREVIPGYLGPRVVWTSSKEAGGSWEGRGGVRAEAGAERERQRADLSGPLQGARPR